MNKLLCIALTAIFGMYAQAQTISGSVKTKLKSEVKMNLARIEGGQQIDIESTEIKPNGIFNFGEVNQPTGLYILYTTQKGRNFEFIINKEKEININFLNSSLSSFEIISSEENKLYSIYNKALKKKNSQTKKLKNKLRNSAISKEEKVKIQNQIDVLEKAFFIQTNDQINTLPESFFSSIILGLNSDNKNDKSRYFDDLDFNNENFIRSRVFSYRFREYVLLYSKGEKFKFMDCIDDIMEKAKVNIKVYEFAANELMTGFYNSGLEEMSNYILNEYIFAEDCGGLGLSEMIKMKGQEIKNLQVGNYPDNIIMENALKNKMELKGIVGKNNYTLLMFWSSTCHSCEGQIPKAKELYKAYNNKGFEIYGVSLDLHKSGWVNALSQNKMNWVNVCDFKGWDSPVAGLYKIVKTPTYFILDKTGKLVGKPRHISEVEQMLAKLIK